MEISQNSQEMGCARVAQVFSYAFPEISKITSSYEHLWWLPLAFPDMVLRNKAK